MDTGSATVTKAPRWALICADIITGDLKAGPAPRANPELLPFTLTSKPRLPLQLKWRYLYIPLKNALSPKGGTGWEHWRGL